MFVRAKNESFLGNNFHKTSEKLRTLIVIGPEWITRTSYVFCDASARVDGQGHDGSDIVRRNTYEERTLSKCL